MDTINVELRGIPYLMRYQAMDAAESYAKQYPDDVGHHRGRFYGALGATDGVWVHHTAGGRIVVRYLPPRDTA